MHCVADDRIGIVAGAVIGSVLSIDWPLAVALEYGLGFGFDWAIFSSCSSAGWLEDPTG